MNIYSAIRGLRNGQAVRPANWRGYVERIDIPLVEEEYDESTTYEVGDKIQRNGVRYVCTVATEEGEAFDSAKWTRIDADRYVVFVDADDTQHPGTNDNPAAIYLGEVKMSNDDVDWSRLAGGTTGADIPAIVKAGHATWPAKCPTPVDMPDDELFKALMADNWESGSIADFESQRVGGGGRW